MAEQKPVLALDLDELLFPFVENFATFVNVKNGTSYAVEDFVTYEFEDTFETTMDVIICWVDEFLRQHDPTSTPVDGAVEAIRSLQSRFTLFVITARDDAHEEHTLAWLHNHFPDMFDKLMFCNLYPPGRVDSRTKAELCDEIDAIGLVDDSIDYVSAVAATGRKGILFGDYPWNRSVVLTPGVVRARNWDELSRVLVA